MKMRSIISLHFLTLLFSFLPDVNALKPRVDVIPSLSNVFLEEGSSFTAQCNAFYETTPGPSDVQPDIFFVFRNVRATNGSNYFIIEKRDTVAKTVSLSITFNNLTEGDGEGLGCRDEISKTTNQIKMHIIPKNNIPEITVDPLNSVVNEGDNLAIKCKVTVEVATIAVTLTWKFGKLLETLPTNAIISGVDGNSTMKNSTLIISNIKQTVNQGAYYCVAVLTVMDKVNINMTDYNKKADVLVTSAANKEVTEEKVKAGEDVTLNCLIAMKTDTLKWYKGNDEINNNTDKRYSFGGTVKGQIFTISDVTYTDRDEYKCQSMVSNLENKYILRVRDPLGALWPFIGMVVEAVLLALVIFLCELKRKSNKSKGRPTEMKETSSLIQTTPKVSYSGGEDVRARVTTGTST